MTAMRAFLLGALLALLIMPGMPAQAQDRDFDVDIFYEELAPYGDWFEHPRWGLVWQPNVDRDWRPYSQGYWSYTDDNGWYWVSDEPFAWAVFHYGRWTYDQDDGWIWIPDTEWGPAWVTWRWSDDYVGWAPLGPGSSWGPDGDLRYDVSYYDSPGYYFAWCFVHPRYLTTPGLYRYLAPRAEHNLIFRRTQHVHGYRRFDRRIVNAGIDVRRFERAIGRPVVRVRLKAVDSPRDLGARRDGGGRDLQVFMPRIISKPGEPKRPPQLKARPDHPKGPGPSVTGFPPGKSGDPGRDRPTGPQIRGVPGPSGTEPQPFKRATTPPPTDQKQPPAEIQRLPSKQVSPSGPGQTDPHVYRKSSPPPSGPPPSAGSGPSLFKGQDARPSRDSGNVAPRVQQVPRQESRPQGPPPGGQPKGPPPAKKDDQDRKGGEVK